VGEENASRGSINAETKPPIDSRTTKFLPLDARIATRFAAIAMLQHEPDVDAHEKLDELHKTLEDASDTIDELESEDD
jgi:hypothetical protein